MTPAAVALAATTILPALRSGSVAAAEWHMLRAFERAQAIQDASGASFRTPEAAAQCRVADAFIAVQGEPGQSDYFGPYWAKIAGKRDTYARLEARIAELLSQRADLEEDIAALITKARDAIAAGRAALEGDET